VGKDLRIIAETEKIGRSDSFLQVKSLEKLEIGKEYLFHCGSCEKKYIIGRPTRELGHNN
jgi:hypothetical protein